MSTIGQKTFKYLQKQDSLDYSKGYTTYLANDVVPTNQLVYATDTRISTLGRQKTRKGCDFLSVPAGQTIDTQQTSVTGASSQNLGLTTWLAAKFTTSTSGRLTRVDLNLKNVASATGPIIVEIHSDSAGTPSSTVLAQSSIPAATPTSSYGYLTARFIEAPLLANATAYWIVAYIQSDGTNTYAWSSTTNATTAKTSSNSGVTWSTSAFDLNYKTYLSTDAGTLGRYRAYKSDGTKVELIAYKEAAGTTAVAKINDLTGVLTTIKTGLSSSATAYNFDIMNDVVIYVNGFDAPRKWDFTTEAALGGSPPISNDLIVHKNRLFLFPAANPTEFIFSEITDAETYISTNFIYVPTPKSPDLITKSGILNDNLYIFTRTTKWSLTGSDLTNMVLRKAPGVKGTKAPASMVVTRNHIYFASDDGFYRFNGSTDEILSELITSDYQGAANRTSMVGAIYNNRYYLWYTPSGGGQNSQCWVFNINYNSIESNDTAAYIAKAGIWDGPADTGQFVQASSLVGAVYYAEAVGNTFNNLGRNITWEIRTKYDHFGQPGSNKHVKRWYPRFTASSGRYSVLCQYDKDFASTPTTIPVSLQGSGYLLGSATPTLGNFTLGVTMLVDPKITVPGLARYVQRRYQRNGVNMPVEFLGDSLYYLVRRPR